MMCPSLERFRVMAVGVAAGELLLIGSLSS
jgi:hypothetical protein